jgi:hypothetical protein
MEKPKKKRGLLLAVIGLVVILCAVLICGWFFLIRTKPQANISELTNDLQMYKDSQQFPLYTPSELPDSLIYHKGSVSSTNGVVIFYLFTSKREKVFVSQQQKPDKVAINDFNTRFIENKVSAVSSEGKAVIGSHDKQLIGSLITDKSWVLINTQADIPHSILESLLENMHPLR